MYLGGNGGVISEETEFDSVSLGIERTRGDWHDVPEAGGTAKL